MQKNPLKTQAPCDGGALSHSRHPSYGSLLQACGEANSLEQGRVVHEHISAGGVEAGSIFLGNHLVQMYGRCGSVSEATAVFERMSRRNVVSWSFVIVANARNGYNGQAMLFFQRMLQDVCEVDRVLIIGVLGSCCDLGIGRDIHALVVECGFGDETVVCTALLGMYCRCGSLEDAESVFESLAEKDVVAWNAMITAIVELGMTRFGSSMSSQVIRMFEGMLAEGIRPSHVTFISMLGALDDEKHCVWLHGIIRESGFEHNEFVVNSLVNSYGKQGRIGKPREAFAAVENASIGTWNSMISAYAQCGHSKEAVDTFTTILQQNIKPDQITFVNVLEAITGPETSKDGQFIHKCVIEHGFGNDVIIGGALLSMYTRCGNLENAEEVFEKIRPYLSVITWNSMLAAYTEFGQCEKALKLFMEMQQNGSTASEATFATILAACANLSSLAQGKMIHSLIDQWLEIHNGTKISNYSYLIIQNGIINMYARCGSLDLALETFTSMRDKDTTSWNSILGAIGWHDTGNKAVIYFRRMLSEGVRPDHITYTSILTACSHHGLYKEGRNCYNFMINVHGLEAKVAHYGCMVDLLGRGGWLDEAEKLIGTMPMPAHSTVWMALLGASRLHGDLDRAKMAMGHLCELEPSNPSPYLLLSNVYDEKSL